ncbi:MAG: DUF4159 domain-containing protein [Lentisphaeria bacterium]|nr:DUF4159 domain-containing protein [Lentisphaeria bacterium]
MNIQNQNLRRQSGRTRPLLLIAACVLIRAGVSAQAKDGAIQCGNLVYAGTHTSRCFSPEFLSTVQRETAVATERRFKSVKLGSDELFGFPFVVMTGEADFTLTRKERQNLRRYLQSGGFILASAGCSSKEWDTAFRREIAKVFDDKKTPIEKADEEPVKTTEENEAGKKPGKLEKIDMKHPMFSSFYTIETLTLSHKAALPPSLEGLIIEDKIVLIYSPHGLNDTAHAEGCCCCGGNEIKNSMQVNVNILIYALLH